MPLPLSRMPAASSLERAAREDVGQQHVVDDRHVAEVAVPVGGVGVAPVRVGVRRVAGLAIGRPVVGPVPLVGRDRVPDGVVRGDGREIDDGVRGARAGDVEGRARRRGDARRVVLPDAHVIEAAERDPERIRVDVVRDREVLAAADALDGEAVGAGAGEAREVDVPDGGARQVVPEDVGAARLPEGHHADRRRLAGAHVVDVDRVALERRVVAGAAVAEPRVEVGGLVVGRGGVADEVDVHRLRAACCRCRRSRSRTWGWRSSPS